MMIGMVVKLGGYIVSVVLSLLSDSVKLSVRFVCSVGMSCGSSMWCSIIVGGVLRFVVVLCSMVNFGCSVVVV